MKHYVIVAIASGMIWCTSIAPLVLGEDSALGKTAGAVPNNLQIDDQIRIVELLRAKRFAELTSLFEAYQQRFESDFQEEVLIEQAYDTFQTTDPTMRSLLDRWVAEKGKSFAPYVARAIYCRHGGWEARGEKFANETSEQQFARMNKLFAEAVADATRALEINPRLVICRELLINIGMATSERKDNQAHLEEALKICPACLEVRATYLLSLTPRWGGSIAAMEQFVSDTEPYRAKNPRLGILAGYKAWELGKQREATGDDEAALRYYNQALARGEYWWFIRDRGMTLNRLKLYDRALEDYGKMLNTGRRRAQALLFQATTLQKMGRTSDAVKAINLAEKLDPSDPSIVQWSKYLRNLDAKNK